MYAQSTRVVVWFEVIQDINDANYSLPFLQLLQATRELYSILWSSFITCLSSCSTYGEVGEVHPSICPFLVDNNTSEHIILQVTAAGKIIMRTGFKSFILSPPNYVLCSSDCITNFEKTWILMTGFWSQISRQVLGSIVCFQGGSFLPIFNFFQGGEYTFCLVTSRFSSLSFSLILVWPSIFQSLLSHDTMVLMILWPC